MIVQFSLVKDELPLLKEMLPVWAKYADGFVFGIHDNTDETYQYLTLVRQKYNILELPLINTPNDKLSVETDVRGKLFNLCQKYTHKILCLDADEYLDGKLTKESLSKLLDESDNTLFLLRWVQYSGRNTIRIDGPWKENYKDRIGNYKNFHQWSKAYKHSSHLPNTHKTLVIDPKYLFIAHISWLNKEHAALKQYYWKVDDYVKNQRFNINTYSPADYDASVNNFNWIEERFEYPCKIDDSIFESYLDPFAYKFREIREWKDKFKVPNLGDWGYGIHNDKLYIKKLEEKVLRLKEKLSSLIK